MTSTVDSILMTSDPRCNEGFNHTVLDCSKKYTATQYIWMIGPPILVALGTIGNLMCFIVLRFSGMRRSPSSLYLQVLAFVDTTVLYTALSRYWILNIYGKDIRAFSNIGCKVHVFVLYLSAHYSAWVLAALSVDRALVVRSGLHTRRFLHQSQVKVALVAILVVLACIDCHFFWTMGLRGKPEEQECIYSENDFENFVDHVFNWMDLGLSVALPFSIMLVCNGIITYKLFQLRRRRSLRMRVHEPYRDVRVSSMTIMLLLTTTGFLLLTSPLVVFLLGDWKIHWDRKPMNYHEIKLDLLWATFNMMYYSNNALNFVFYSLSGSRFRRELCALFSKPCTRERKVQANPPDYLQVPPRNVWMAEQEHVEEVKCNLVQRICFQRCYNPEVHSHVDRNMGS